MPLEHLHHRRYTTVERIDSIAKYYYEKTKRGITYIHLMNDGVANHKKQAQSTLKRFLRRGVLFTMGNRKPQQYFPTSIKSEIMQAMLSKNDPVKPTGIDHLFNSDEIINQTLVAYVLPLLPTAPLYVHNIHLKLKIEPEYYNELSLPIYRKNLAKHHEEIIGNYNVKFTAYPNGTLEVYISSSNMPFKIDSDVDLGRLFVFIGQVKQCLVDLLHDLHERVVPDVMQWELTECDLNKDIQVSHAFHSTGIKIQVKHSYHLFRLYFKAMGKDTVCRVEKSETPHKPVISALQDVFTGRE